MSGLAVPLAALGVAGQVEQRSRVRLDVPRLEQQAADAGLHGLAHAAAAAGDDGQAGAEGLHDGDTEGLLLAGQWTAAVVGRKQVALGPQPRAGCGVHRAQKPDAVGEA